MSLLVGFALVSSLFGGVPTDVCVDSPLTAEGTSLSASFESASVGAASLEIEEDFVIFESIASPAHTWDYGPLGERTESQREPEIDDDSERIERVSILLALVGRVSRGLEPPPIEAATAPHEDSHLATVRSPRGPPLA